MATTRIMPLHVGKGRTESRAISDIIDYVANPKKTDNGRLITGYACDSRTADAEFLLAKRQYIAAKVWYVCGLVMLPITVIFMLLVIGKNEDCVGSMGKIICGVQLIPLIGSILQTEIALKKNFDKNGTRR